MAENTVTPSYLKIQSEEEFHDLLSLLDEDREDVSEDSSDLKDDLKNDSTDINKWEQALKKYQDKFDSVFDSEDKDSVDKSTVLTIFKIYYNILSRFPYYSKYWKDWSIFAYKSKGVQSSIRVLEKAVQQHPYCIDLWSDYLAALISQLESTEDETKKSQAIEHLRLQYNHALDLNAYNFNSHPIWDNIFRFETSLDPLSEVLLSLCSRAIRIPLYQYSSYFEKYNEICKNFELGQLLDETEVKTYLEKFDRERVSDFSAIEKQQIIDDYSYQIFSETQKAVNEKWEYESTIHAIEFDLNDLDNIKSEYSKWIEYLQFDIRIYKSTYDDHSLKSVYSIFERFLTPNCLNEDAWFHYISFIYSTKLPEEKKFEKMNEVYTRATNKFIALDKPKLHLSYIDFLKQFGKSDMAINYLLDLIKLASGVNRPKLYLKYIYIKGFAKLLSLWKDKLDPVDYKNFLKSMIDDYFVDDSPASKRHHESKPSNNKQHEMSQALNIYNNVLVNFFNDNALCVIVLAYLNELKDSQPSEATTIRVFFSKHFKKGVFKNSGKFWLFFINHEGLIQKNFQNLETIVYYMKTSTQLPKPVIDNLLGLYKDIISSNLHISLTNQKVLDSFLKIDNDTSNGIILNSAMKDRFALNNSIVKDLEVQRPFKNHGSFNRKDEFIKLLVRQGNHPGIISESQPEVTNSVLTQFTRISLLDDNIEMLPLPSFKNVEKANLPLNQPSE